MAFPNFENMKDLILLDSPQYEDLCKVHRKIRYLSTNAYLRLKNYPQTKFFLKLVEEASRVSDTGLWLVELIQSLEHSKIIYICSITLNKVAELLINKEEGCISKGLDILMNQVSQEKYDELFRDSQCIWMGERDKLLKESGPWARRICNAVNSYVMRGRIDADKSSVELEKYIPVILLFELEGGFLASRELQKLADEAFEIELKWVKFIDFCYKMKDQFIAADLNPVWFVKVNKEPVILPMQETSSAASGIGNSPRE